MKGKRRFNKNKVLILGNGFIGNRLHDELGWRLSDKRIYSFKDIDAEIKKYKPEIIINCIGYTGKRNVDDCEKDIDKTIVANTFVPILLGEVALRHGIKLVHISSGCIYHYDYERQRPITENKVPDYYDLYYSRSKIYSEAVLKELAIRYNILVLRMRIPMDNRPHPKNIIDKLIKYKRVLDIPNSVTYVPDFIKAMKYLISIDAVGIYNVVCKGALRYPQLMDVYRRYRPEFKYEILPLEELGLDRTNLILSTKKLEATGFPVRSIKEVVEECIKEYVKY